MYILKMKNAVTMPLFGGIVTALKKYFGADVCSAVAWGEALAVAMLPSLLPFWNWRAKPDLYQS
jgi:hypothetical protein